MRYIRCIIRIAKIILLFATALLVLLGISVYALRIYNKYVQSTGKLIVIEKINHKCNRELCFYGNIDPIIRKIKEKYKIKLLAATDHRLFNRIQSFLYPQCTMTIDGPYRLASKKKICKNYGIHISYNGENDNAFYPKVYDMYLGFETVDDEKHFRYPLYYDIFHKYIDTSYYRGRCRPKKEYFACFLGSPGMKFDVELGRGEFDGVAARKHIFDLLTLYKFVASGGSGKNNIRYIVPRKDTMAFLGRCKFVIAYENQTYDGYVTEKLPQAYIAGAIPIYYGTKYAKKDFNENAFIYTQDFKSPDDLVRYIKKVDQDDNLYCKIWSQKLFIHPERNYDVVISKLGKKVLKLLESHIREGRINEK